MFGRCLCVSERTLMRGISHGMSGWGFGTEQTGGFRTGDIGICLSSVCMLTCAAQILWRMKIRRTTARNVYRQSCSIGHQSRGNTLSVVRTTRVVKFLCTNRALYSVVMWTTSCQNVKHSRKRRRPVRRRGDFLALFSLAGLILTAHECGARTATPTCAPTRARVGAHGSTAAFVALPPCTFFSQSRGLYDELGRISSSSVVESCGTRAVPPQRRHNRSALQAVPEKEGGDGGGTKNKPPSLPQVCAITLSYLYVFNSSYLQYNTSKYEVVTCTMGGKLWVGPQV